MNYFPKAKDRVFDRNTVTRFGCTNFHDDGDQILMHVVQYDEGSKGSFVPKNLDANKTLIEEKDAPTDFDYMSGDVCVMIKGDHILVCGGNLRDSTVQTYLWKLFTAAQLSPQESQFYMSDCANKDNLALIQRYGAREINLNVSTSLGNFENMKFSNQNSTSRMVQSLFCKTTRLMRTASTTAKMTIKGGKLKKDEDPIENWITQQAIQLVSDEEEGSEYEIVLRNKERIFSNSLRASKEIQVSRHGISFDHAEVWKKMSEYFAELTANKMLE